MNKTPPVHLAISCGHNRKEDSVRAAAEKLHAYMVKGTDLQSLVLYREEHTEHGPLNGIDFNKFMLTLLPGLPVMAFSALSLLAHEGVVPVVLGNDARRKACGHPLVRLRHDLSWRGGQ